MEIQDLYRLLPRAKQDIATQRPLFHTLDTLDFCNPHTAEAYAIVCRTFSLMAQNADYKTRFHCTALYFLNITTFLTRLTTHALGRSSFAGTHFIHLGLRLQKGFVKTMNN